MCFRTNGNQNFPIIKNRYRIFLLPRSESLKWIPGRLGKDFTGIRFQAQNFKWFHPLSNTLQYRIVLCQTNCRNTAVLCYRVVWHNWPHGKLDLDGRERLRRQVQTSGLHPLQEGPLRSTRCTIDTARGQRHRNRGYHHNGTHTPRILTCPSDHRYRLLPIRPSHTADADPQRYRRETWTTHIEENGLGNFALENFLEQLV